MRARVGLSLIEVLVALALLSIIGAALISSFALTTRINRDASEDVDYSRVVRSVMERVKVVWLDPERWDDEFAETAAVNEFVKRFNADCEAAILTPSDAARAGDTVRVLEIRCGGGAEGVPQQAFQMEFGSP